MLLDGEPVVVPASDGDRTTPSVVAVLEDQRIVGTNARRQAPLAPERTIQSIKRLMGRRVAELPEDLSPLTCPIVEGPGGAARVRVGDDELSPEEISATILRTLRDDASAMLGETVTRAVITVPAYFDDAQRQATRDAGTIAGLEVLRIVNEPTAAALAYGRERHVEGRILVWDMGGGTFDVSVLEIGDGVYDVLATAGDNRLGGDDWDRMIVDWMLAEAAAEGATALGDDAQAVQRLFEAAERAKRELSNVTETGLNLPFLSAGVDGPYHFTRQVTRAFVEELTRPLLDRTDEPMRQVLADSGVAAADLDAVLLVGGMTRWPAVQDRVRALAGTEPARGVNPDEAVAMGAAIHAASLAEKSGDTLLVDVTSLTLGVETQGGLVVPLIGRNTTIPTSRKEIFTTSEDDQTSVEVHVLQGERPFAQDCRSLGRVHLLDLPPAPRGSVAIEVEFSLDEDGILKVTARHAESGQDAALSIEGASSLTAADLERLVAEAEKTAEVDAERLALAETRNRGEALCYATERVLKRAGDLDMPEYDALKGALIVLREQLELTDRSLIAAASEALVLAAEAFADAAQADAQNIQPGDSLSLLDDATLAQLATTKDGSHD